MSDLPRVDNPRSQEGDQTGVYEAVETGGLLVSHHVLQLSHLKISRGDNTLVEVTRRDI